MSALGRLPKPFGKEIRSAALVQLSRCSYHLEVVIWQADMERCAGTRCSYHVAGRHAAAKACFSGHLSQADMRCCVGALERVIWPGDTRCARVLTIWQADTHCCAGALELVFLSFGQICSAAWAQFSGCSSHLGRRCSLVLHGLTWAGVLIA